MLWGFWVGGSPDPPTKVAEVMEEESALPGPIPVGRGSMPARDRPDSPSTWLQLPLALSRQFG